MTIKRSTTSAHRKYSFGLFIMGVSLILISFLIQLIFIRGTNFKQEYQKRQYRQCLKLNSKDTCNTKYPQSIQ